MRAAPGAGGEMAVGVGVAAGVCVPVALPVPVPLTLPALVPDGVALGAGDTSAARRQGSATPPDATAAGTAV
jgi:hypothetical protein